MNSFSQGDIIKIEGKKNLFLIVSSNTFINSTRVFHICPIENNISENTFHIKITGIENTSGVALCENVFLLIPNEKALIKVDSITYAQIMEISDLLQEFFVYD